MGMAAGSGVKNSHIAQRGARWPIPSARADLTSPAPPRYKHWRSRGDSRREFPAAREDDGGPTVAFWLPTLVIGLGALALAGAAAMTLAPRFRAHEPPRSVAVTLGAERLTLSSAYLRPNARQGGAMDALDLAAFFPGFLAGRRIERRERATPTSPSASRASFS